MSTDPQAIEQPFVTASVERVQELERKVAILMDEHGPITAAEAANDTDPRAMASKIAVLQRQVDLLTRGLDAVWAKYMDQPIDLSEPTIIPQ